jgi:hypothetical protein
MMFLNMRIKKKFFEKKAKNVIKKGIAGVFSK